MMLSILSCVCWQSIYLLWRNVCLGLLPIFKFNCFFLLLLSCGHHLCTLDINPLSEIQFANIFSHSVGCLFTLLIAMQKFLSLIYFHLLIIAFCACAFSIISKKALPNPVAWSFPPIFYCRTFILSHYILGLYLFWVKGSTNSLKSWGALFILV